MRGGSEREIEIIFRTMAGAGAAFRFIEALCPGFCSLHRRNALYTKVVLHKEAKRTSTPPPPHFVVEEGLRVNCRAVEGNDKHKIEVSINIIFSV